MGICFKISLTGYVLILLPYFLSLEHNRLERWFKENSVIMGDALGYISGWGFFCFWIGLWICPQKRFRLGYPVFTIQGITFGSMNIGLSFLLLLPAFWFGIKGVLELGFKTSETHRPSELVTTGVYGVVRHPQYLGGLFGHLGVSFLFGSRDALLVTPIVFIVVYLLCWKEEKELLREFGRRYRRYREEVPMLIPRR